MKCPYHNCQKDYNSEWKNEIQTVSATSNCKEGDGLRVVTFTCQFCERQFHEIYRVISVEVGRRSYMNNTKELLFTFPSSKTKFEAKKIPKNIKDAFSEAERCRSIGSLSGVGACLRKTIYMICDDQQVSGDDYRKKIGNLPFKGGYKELLKQIKFLGDNTTKPGEEKYVMKDADLALDVLPILIEELYAKDEKIDEVEKILAKVRSTKKND